MRLNKKGFTIIELMVASLVFSSVLLVCTYGLLAIGRSYYKGVTNTRTQEAARRIVEEISQAIQFSAAGDSIVPTPGTAGPAVPYHFCVNGARYSVILDRRLVETVSASNASEESKNVLVRDDVSGCPVDPIGDMGSLDLTTVPSARELLPLGMRLAKLTVSTDAEGRLYTVTARVVTGQNEILSADRTACSLDRNGSQFCAFSELITVVQKRIQ